MNEGKISVRYAKAYVEFVSEKNILDEALNDMNVLIDFCENEIFKKLLRSPSIKKSEKKEFFNQLFKDKFNKNTFSFLELILKNNRESFLPLIARKFVEEYKLRKNIKTAVLTSVNSLSNTQKNELLKKVTSIFNSEIELLEVIDEKIIGGFVLTVEDQQFDASIASKLKNIQEQLINATFEN